MKFNETICAISTAIGNGGISIIRLSGADALNIAKKVFFTKNNTKKFSPRYMYLGDILDGDKFIDRGLGVYFKGPNSYTGEDVFEFHCHGGTIVSKMLINLLINNGARPAEPGEFTKRAFLNGKIDISQAEGISDQIFSLSEEAARISALQLRGDLYNKVKTVQDKIKDVIAEVEAGVEYPEEDLEQHIVEKAIPVLNSCKDELEKLAKTFNSGKFIKDGIKVAILGKPNVGKSSLMNAIFSSEKVIVSDIPGTTRDTVSDYFLIHSVPVLFTDTAGIRETDDIIEKIGVEKSLKAINDASVALIVLDSSKPLDQEDLVTIDNVKKSSCKVIYVVNKIDIKDNSGFALPDNSSDFIEISAKNKIGIEDLLEKIYSNVISDSTIQEGVVITNSRHYYSILSAVNSLTDGIENLRDLFDLACVSIDIHDAWSYLGEVTGETLNENIIDRIFENFCLGK